MFFSKEKAWCLVGHSPEHSVTLIPFTVCCLVCYEKAALMRQVPFCPRYCLSPFYALILATVTDRYCYYFHFTEKKTEAQKGPRQRQNSHSDDSDLVESKAFGLHHDLIR